MHLKILGRANGDFSVIEVIACSFHRHPEAVARIKRIAVNHQGMNYELEEDLPLFATAYLLNRDGKTIDTFAINQTDR